MAFIGEHLWENPETGIVHGTGCLPPTKAVESMAVYADQQPMYTLDQIKTHLAAGRGDNRRFTIGPKLNQTEHPWCWAFGSTKVLMMTIYALTGKWIVLDPALGILVTGKTGGNAIDAMLLQVQSVYGAIPASFSGNDPIGGDVDPSRIPADWKPEAAKIVVPKLGWQVLHSEEEISCACINGHFVNRGLAWEDDGGHDVSNDSCTLDSQGNIVPEGDNSWGDWNSGWGAMKGFPGRWQRAANRINGTFNGDSFGAYALVRVNDPQDVPDIV